MPSNRADRVGDLIRAELGDILLTEMRDPRVRLASASSVQVSRDLSHATVMVSSLATDEEERTQTIEALRRASGFLRRTLAARLRLRRMPELHFELDRGAEHSRQITDLLDELHQGDDERGVGADTDEGQSVADDDETGEP
ncbi:MAG: 30S ribosome-binding factor RbfA [Acidobacteria bacterium]|nr:MAG: 30S ribosome-binding factor RbfA [Acidobacteriota bacterium]REK00203.1 MAG: 30S ribosome-binding factor RbfA [Acidobacteriota bacterium]